MSQDMGTGRYPCPCDLIRGEKDCGRVLGTKNGAVMHAVNKSDDYHAGIRKPAAYAALRDFRGVGDTDAADPDLSPWEGADAEGGAGPESTGPESTGPESTSPESTTAVTDGSGAVDAVMPDVDGSDSSASPDSTSPDSTSPDSTSPDSTSPDSTGTADCPECGADLEMTEAEALAFIREHGGAFCDQCGAKLVDGGSA